MTAHDKTRCLICERPAIGNMDPFENTVPMCSLHEPFIIEMIREVSTKSPQERLLGFGIAHGPIDPSDPGGTPLVCDKDGATYSGIPGDYCLWCLRDYCRVTKEDRTRILRDPIELDPDNRDYESAVARRGRRLADKVKDGLITRAEALATLDRLVAHVR